jgi:hypothetical protein
MGVSVLTVVGVGQGMDDATIHLLLLWGMIVYIPVLPYVLWLQLIAFWQVRALAALWPLRVWMTMNPHLRATH